MRTPCCTPDTASFHRFSFRSSAACTEMRGREKSESGLREGGVRGLEEVGGSSHLHQTPYLFSHPLFSL
jgi:hypothetical protein